MKRNFLICLILMLFLSFGISAFAATPINPSSDLTYLGAFKLPTLPSGYVWPLFDGAGYNKGGMSYYPPHSALLVMCGPGQVVATRRYVAEVSIPELKIDNYSSLNSGKLLHDPVDIIGVSTVGTYANLGDVHYFTKQGSQTSDKLYVSIYGSYTTSSIYSLFNGQFAWTETNLDDLCLKGWWRFDLGSRFVGKYIFHTPTAWADAHVDGKYLIAGFYRGGGGATFGPTLYAFAPWESCEGNCDTNPPPDAEDGAAPDTTYSDPVPPELKHTLPYHTLLQYSGTIGEQTMKDAAPNDKFGDGAWVTVGNKSSVVLFGWKCGRAWEDYKWQYPNAPSFIKFVNEGYHDEPGYPALFFYNADDLAAVADGTKEPYEPQPYAVVNLLPYFYYKAGLGFSTDGMAYDETKNILYLRENTSTYQGGYQAIHAFRLSENVTSLDATPPSAPVVNLDSASHESVTFSWVASTDNSGKPIVYEIFRNNAPIAFTTSASYSDDFYEYYPAPVEYHVVAIDFNGNTSRSNTIRVDDSNGGNAPINVFIPTLANTPNEHETSTALKVRQNVEYSFTPKAIGGTPPYTWSATGLPSGLNINQQTGVISGNVGSLSLGPRYTPVITVIDQKGNICRRRTGFKVCPTSTVDLDGDGYNAVVDGGADQDDNTIMVNPLNPTQPAPTNLQIESTNGDSVTLSWTAAEQRQHIGWEPSRGAEKDWRKYQGDITYRIYYGTSPGVYNNKVYVGRTTTCTLTGISDQTYYFAVTALSYRGLESVKSSMISTLGGNINPLDIPSIPSGLIVVEK